MFHIVLIFIKCSVNSRELVGFCGKDGSHIKPENLWQTVEITCWDEYYFVLCFVCKMESLGKRFHKYPQRSTINLRWIVRQLSVISRQGKLWNTYSGSFSLFAFILILLKVEHFNSEPHVRQVVFMNLPIYISLETAKQDSWPSTQEGELI